MHIKYTIPRAQGARVSACPDPHGQSNTTQAPTFADRGFSIRARLNILGFNLLDWHPVAIAESEKCSRTAVKNVLPNLHE